MPYTSENIDWDKWIPKERAVLVFIIRDENILLIHKKRGLGAGKINAPGGRIEGHETACEAAIREVQEEVIVTPKTLVRCGELAFQFTNGYSILVIVFHASNYTGKPQETIEAVPLWTPIDQIPYHQMWEDDQLWIPLMLQGHTFKGHFIFDGDKMLFHQVVTLE